MFFILRDRPGGHKRDSIAGVSLYLDLYYTRTAPEVYVNEANQSDQHNIYWTLRDNMWNPC